MNFICDTDILSSLGKIERLDLLRILFPKNKFFIPEQVYNELSVALELGFNFPERIFEFVNVISLSSEELEEYLDLTKSEKSLGKGELECIAVATIRKWIMLTDDRIAKRIARKHGIKVWDILDILKALFISEEKSKQDIMNILEELEQKDGMIVKDYERLFD